MRNVKKQSELVRKLYRRFFHYFYFLLIVGTVLFLVPESASWASVICDGVEARVHAHQISAIRESFRPSSPVISEGLRWVRVESKNAPTNSLAESDVIAAQMRHAHEPFGIKNEGTLIELEPGEHSPEFLVVGYNSETGEIRAIQHQWTQMSAKVNSWGEWEVHRAGYPSDSSLASMAREQRLVSEKHERKNFKMVTMHWVRVETFTLAQLALNRKNWKIVDIWSDGPLSGFHKRLEQLGLVPDRSSWLSLPKQKAFVGQREESIPSIAFEKPQSAQILNYRVGSHNIEFRFFGEHRLKTLEVLKATAEYLIKSTPEALLRAVTDISFVSETIQKSGDAVGLAKKTSIAVVEPNTHAPHEVAWHEMGHALAEQIWENNHRPDELWSHATFLDGKVQRWHGDFLQEDFAQTVAEYMRTEGGLSRPEARREFFHRFALLDKILLVNENWIWEQLLEKERAAGDQ